MSTGRRRSVALLLAAVAVTGSCSRGQDTTAGGGPATPDTTPVTTTDSTPPTPPTTTVIPTTPTPQTCGEDLLGPDRPSVELQLPDAVIRSEVVGTGPYPCASRVWVDDGGIAVFLFGSDGACHFAQSSALKPGTAVAREPDGTMLRIDQGMANCTLAEPITLCGPGSIIPTSAFTQVALTCDPDPVFQVSVHAGSATVVTPAGAKVALKAGQFFSCDPTNCPFILKPDEGGVFTEDAQSNFANQIRMLRLSPNVFAPESQGPVLLD